jgi:hypothetical protein
MSFFASVAEIRRALLARRRGHAQSHPGGAGASRVPQRVKQLMWRMAQKGLLVAVDGTYRRNEATPAANDGAAHSCVTGVTAVTPVTIVTHETATAKGVAAAGVVAKERENAVTNQADATEPEGHAVTRVTAVTRHATEYTPDQAAAGITRVSPTHRTRGGEEVPSGPVPRATETEPDLGYNSVEGENPSSRPGGPSSTSGI